MTNHRLSSYDPNVIYQRLIELGEQWADKNAAADLLEETRKSVLAEVMVSEPAKSRTEREDAALRSSQYREHIRAMVDARREANRARVHYDAARAKLEMMRTLEATKRDEARLAGMQH